MKECLECNQEFDETKRNSDFWKKEYEKMGCMADLCNRCWLKEYGINVLNK